jgi:hypothetical protein
MLDPQYRAGATFQYLPEHTWALGMTYARARTTVALTVTGTGLIRNSDDALFVEHIEPGVRLDQNRWTLRANSSIKDEFYDSHNQGYALADVTASHQFTHHVESVLEIQNLTDHYTLDASARAATIGRQTRLGFRIR